MVLQKTCWLATIHPLRVGCLIGAAVALPLDPLIRLGFFFGAAFQIQDDLLNLAAGSGLRQGAQRRSLRGQAHADDHPRAAAAASEERATGCSVPRLRRAERRREVAMGARSARPHRCDGACARRGRAVWPAPRCTSSTSYFARSGRQPRRAIHAQPAHLGAGARRTDAGTQDDAMTTILLYGATGFTGRLIAAEAPARAWTPALAAIA